jgi:hypothetical protein
MFHDLPKALSLALIVELKEEVCGLVTMSVIIV